MTVPIAIQQAQPARMVRQARASKPQIKSLSWAGSLGFVSARLAAQDAFADLYKRDRTTVNCNPKCNLGCLRERRC